MVVKEEHLGGMFGNVGLLDVSSMHPSSIVAMNLFGPYTERFDAIRQARIAIKHKDFDRCLDIFRKFVPEERIKDLEPVLKGEDSKALAQALKIAINAVYGLTSASFPTRFNDAANPNNRNLDNKVAKRGALFMIALKHKVQELGYTVVHIKTDSIKIADVDRDIIDFVTAMGKQYGYNFELESVYDKMCIVNKSTYIAHSAYGEHCGEWTATGLQFQVPYVFKTLSVLRISERLNRLSPIFSLISMRDLNRMSIITALLVKYRPFPQSNQDVEEAYWYVRTAEAVTMRYLEQKGIAGRNTRSSETMVFLQRLTDRITSDWPMTRSIPSNNTDRTNG